MPISGYYVPASKGGGINQRCDPSVCVSVSLFHAPSSKNGALYSYGYHRTLTRNTMLEVEPIGQRSRNVTNK